MGFSQGFLIRMPTDELIEGKEKLNYKPDVIARSLRTKKSKAIGVIVSDIVTFFFTTLVRGIEDVANQGNYSVILCNSDEDPIKEREYLSDLYERGIDRKNPPTALFVSNEPMTNGALLALRENKVKIPEEMSIIGFDGPVWAP